MPVVYFDTSALVKRYLEESGSDEVGELFSRLEQAATSTITQVEMSAALARAKRENRLIEEEAERALRSFEEEWEDLLRIPLTDRLFTEAKKLTWKYPLKAYNAIHLASARLLQANLEIEEDLYVATFDRQLWQAAEKSGLIPWPQSPPWLTRSR